MRKALMTTACLITLLGGAAQAQTTRITDLIVVDRPTLVIDDPRFQQALTGSQVATPAARSAAGRLRTIEEIVAATFGASEIIDRTLGLGGVPQLQFGQPGNKAGVEQDGIHNQALIDQQSQAGWTIVNQLGEDNSADVRQIDRLLSTAPLSLNRAYVGQVSFNTPSGMNTYSQWAIINQSFSDVGGGLRPNHAAIQQGGIRALSDADQNVPLVAIGWNNVAQIDQDGSGNDAVIQQGAENAIVFSAGAGDTLGQNNRGLVVQVGFDNSAVLSQEDDSTATIKQFGYDNRAFIQQDGDPDLNENFSLVEQGLAGADASNNFATVLQLGYNARSTVLQESSDNQALVEQTFRAAEADSFIRQTGGNGNYANVLQDAGDDTYAGRLISVIVQNGSVNNAYVRQTNAAGSRSAISQTGRNNSAEVYQ